MGRAGKVLGAVSVLTVVTLSVLYGCGDDETTFTRESVVGGDDASTTPDTTAPNDSGGGDSAPAKRRAKASLTPTGLPDSGTPTGAVEIEDDGTKTTVKITIGGATDGYHGVHIHNGTACDNDDAGYGGAAGGHWNPTDAGHGFPTSPTHHAGDLGNVIVTNGTGGTDLTTTTIELDDGHMLNPIGKAVIFHQGTDDGVTQPTGDAGTRAACGILQKQ